MSRKLRRRDDPRRYKRGSSSVKRNGNTLLSLSQLNTRIKDIQPFIQNNRTAVGACLVFGVCMLFFVLIHSWLTSSSLFDRFVEFTASTTGFMLNIFNDDVIVVDKMVSSPEFQMGIIGACTGLIPLAIYISAILAYPSAIWQKVIGIIAGAIGIYAVNIVRTSSLFVIGTHFPSFFDTAHYLVWQALMILVAVAFWLLWISRLVHVNAE